MSHQQLIRFAPDLRFRGCTVSASASIPLLMTSRSRRSQTFIVLGISVSISIGQVPSSSVGVTAAYRHYSSRHLGSHSLTVPVIMTLLSWCYMYKRHDTVPRIGATVSTTALLYRTCIQRRQTKEHSHSELPAQFSLFTVCIHPHACKT